MKKRKSKISDVYQSSFTLMGNFFFFLSSTIGPEPVCPSRETACTDFEGERGVVAAGAQGVTDTHEARHCYGSFKVRGNGTKASSNFQSTWLI